MEKVKFEISAAGFEYASGEYKNLESMLNVKCKNNHQVMFTLKQLRSGRCVCPICEEYASIEREEMKIETPHIAKAGKRFLALDQATEKTGFAIFEDDGLLSYGLKEVKNKEAALRIAELRQWLVSMIKQWEINEVALENIYYSGNPQTLITLGRLLGALEATCLDILNKPAVVVSPSTWRSHCGIKGKNRNQQKENAQNYIKNKYGIVVSQYAADAICIGIYLSDNYKFEEVMKWE